MSERTGRSAEVYVIQLGFMPLGSIERVARKWLARGPGTEMLDCFKINHDAIDAVWISHIADPSNALACTPTASTELH